MFNALARFKKSSLLLASLGALIVPAAAHAQASEVSILDWDTVPGIDASQVNTFDIGGGIVDITFFDTNNFTEFGGALTPQVNTILNGDNPDSDQSLHLQIDPQGGLGSAGFQADFSGFSKPLVDVSFLLFDVDFSSSDLWQDMVTLTGFGAGGALVDPVFTILGDTAVASSSNVLSGVTNAGNDTALGNVLVSFNNISSFDLTFADGSDLSLADQDSHGIGVGDIEVAAVPEPTTALAIGAFALALFSKRKFASNE